VIESLPVSQISRAVIAQLLICLFLPGCATSRYTDQSIIGTQAAIGVAAPSIAARIVARGGVSDPRTLVAESLQDSHASRLGISLTIVRDGSRPHLPTYLVGEHGQSSFPLAGFNSPELTALDRRLPRIADEVLALERAALYVRLLTASGANCLVFPSAVASGGACEETLVRDVMSSPEYAKAFLPEQTDSADSRDRTLTIRVRVVVAHETYAGHHRVEPVVFAFLFHIDNGLEAWHAAVGEAWRTER